MTTRTPASVSERSFDCPHCGVFTSQLWWRAYLRRVANNGTPEVVGSARIPDLERTLSDVEESDKAYVRRMLESARGAITMETLPQDMLRTGLANLWVSQCYACNKLSVWRHESLMYPAGTEGEAANPDMPSDVREDYDEARTILNASPRGAAALLRLAIQKLCVHLGEPGKNINEDIGSLVAKGLPKQIQQALDTVRVIGNDAVHPGELDLRDDRQTVYNLLRIINVVIDNRISQQKHIDEMYSLLSPSKTAAIEERNAKAIEKLAQSRQP